MAALANQSEAPKVASCSDDKRSLCSYAEDLPDIVKFGSTLKSDIVSRLFHQALSITLKSFQLVSMDDLPAMLEEIADIWQDMACVQGNVVHKGQTRTPGGLVQQMIDVVPRLVPSLDDPDKSSNHLKRVLDPACGSGIILGSLCYREASQSKALINLLSLSTEHQPASPQILYGVIYDEATSALTSITRCLYGIDIDPVSCMLTKMSLLCSIGPYFNALRNFGSSLRTRLWTLPRLHIFCGSAPSLFVGRAVSGKELNIYSNCLSKDILPLWKVSFDVVIQNPPYRNMQRDYSERSGAAFSFLENGNDTCWTLSNFHHHNLYGYFLQLGLDRLTPGGMMVAIVLRNIFDLRKYPQDAGFHLELLKGFTIVSVNFGCLAGADGGFSNLPLDERHKKVGGISTLMLVVMASIPSQGHTFRAQSKHNLRAEIVAEHDEIVNVDVNAVTYNQVALKNCGLGVIDPVLCNEIGRNRIITQWERFRNSLNYEY